ncbi:MAG TPA: translocation/assembly module TamB domain-containing protein [Pyrinomonadaceae bacterium]|nr:translocation/assembly module TamB domain-containing protein [Pyrinomonadaceae bacterium]
MPEENDNQTEKIQETSENETPNVTEETPSEAQRRQFFTRRNAVIAFGLAAILIVLLASLTFVTYRYGYADNYVKQQFVAKMAEIGVVFDADVFRLTVNPLQLELKNATFNDKLTGEKLFRIGEARLGLTVKDLYSWQLSRDISIDTTDLNDVEAWVKFDENGNSNFSNLKLIEDQAGSRVNFNYSSVKASIKNGLIHFGDAQHKINADAKNVQLFLEPTDYTVPDEEKRYKFDFTSTDSNVVYDENPIEPIDIRANGIVDNLGAEISSLKLTSPLGESSLSGTLTDWASLKYNLNIDSTVDLTQTSNLLPIGTPLRGVGNFSGTVTGEGTKYLIKGEIKSDALAASNIRLKALQLNATVDGDGAMYNANGKAVAEMLTFEDFQIDFPQIVGNVRGTGTDFRWFGELQAAAAKSPLGTIAGLFISDAVAEYKDSQLEATLGNVRTRTFSSADADIQGLQANNVKINSADGITDVSVPNLRAGVFKAEGATIRGVNAGSVKLRNRGDQTDVNAGNLRADSIETADAKLRGVNANNIKLRNRGNRTDVDAGNLRAASVETKDARLRNLNVGGVALSQQNNSTNITARNVQADGLDASGAKVGGLNASGVNVQITGNETQVYSNNLKVAKVQTDAAILGSLNVAGVRLTIRQGRIEAKSGDINAGNVALTKSVLPDGGNLENVKIYKPVFVLEPSGRYRASADMSLGGGVLGSVRLGSARASVVAENNQIALNNLTADVMDGNINGDAVLALNKRNRSRVDADFANLDLSKLLALQGGKVVPIEGKTTGKVNLTFAGTDFKTASGTLTADFAANAGTAERGLVPVNGRLGLTATNGLFDVDFANLNTEKSAVNATGRFDLSGENSNLNLALNSTDASEIERIVRVLNVAPEIVAQLDSYRAQFAGNLNLNGNVTGNLTDPTFNGRASIGSLILRERNLGSVATNITVSPDGFELRDGVLQERDGGNLAFNVNIPRAGTNNISVNAKLNNVNTGNLLAALPIDILPAQIQNFQAQTSGTINVSGIPGNLQGEANISSGKGTVNGQPFDGFDAQAKFQGNLVNLEKFEARFGDGFLRANGNYNTDSTAFNFDVQGKDIALARVRPFLPSGTDLSGINGTIDLTAKATGRGSDARTYDVNFNGVGRNIVVNDNALGEVTFVGRTENQQLNANLTANFQGQPQAITASVNFADENLPFRAETTFNNTELAPFIGLYPPPGDVTVAGQATGRVFLEGNLSGVDATGKRGFTTDNLSGAAEFTRLDLQIGDTPLVAVEPVSVRFNTREVVVNNAKFSGGGSNIVVSGTKALTDDGMNNLTVDGKINLQIFNALSKNTFLAGLANVSVRLTGVNRTARLNGAAELQNATAATFIGAERLSFDRIKGRIIFNSNQVQIESLSAFLGGGKITASGGASLEGLELQGFRLNVNGSNFTAPLPPDFITTGDAEIEISGRRIDGQMNSLIAGRILARRTVYNKDIDLADFISRRREGSLSEGSSGSSSSFLGVPKLDIRIEGRDALVVRNNLADLTASAALRITGDVEFPQISGRVTANSGTITFRKDRYEVQRAVLEFPPNTSIEPYINLQATTEIKGYQITVNLVGELTNTESLNATVRSSPALPQADVVSLITTGNLANSDTGIPTLAQSGINTAAEILTDSLINNPLSKATDKLFGLNRFEIDPIISGQRLNPSARLTVGRQINRNLLITYSTNLSEDQNQVLALEYRVSNRLSFVAQYEQRSLSNVTRNSSNFSFEIRLRKRF